MNEPVLTLSELRLTELRLALTAVDAQLGALSLDDSKLKTAQTLDELKTSWEVFVKLLALEPEPARRKCPSCRGPIRLEATRCVHCWSKSPAQK